MKVNIEKKKLRDFGFFIGFGFPLLIGWILPSLSGHAFRSWTLFISLPSLVFATSNPILLFYPYQVWMKIGYFLGWINSRIILGLVFILILCPIALIMRIFGYDPLRQKKDKSKSFKEIKENQKSNFTRIF